MSTSATAQLSTVLTAIETLGYKFTNEIFDFEDTPSTVLDKAYRFELATNGIEEMTGKCVDKSKRLDLWFAYKVDKTKTKIKANLISFYDLQETIEDTLLNALVSIESLVIDSVNSQFNENYYIINLGFNFTYRRNLS